MRAFPQRVPKRLQPQGLHETIFLDAVQQAFDSNLSSDALPLKQLFLRSCFFPAKQQQDSESFRRKSDQQ